MSIKTKHNNDNHILIAIVLWICTIGITLNAIIVHDNIIMILIVALGLGLVSYLFTIPVSKAYRITSRMKRKKKQPSTRQHGRYR